MDKIITLEEVKKHRRKSSVWMVIHNDVYDVTSFLEEHPGGEDSLMDVAGKDGTQGFEDVGHSDDARELLKKYKIGTLPPQQKSAFLQSCCKVKRKTSETLERKYEKSKGPKPAPSPTVERRVQSVVVPRERRRIRRPRPPPPPSSNLKWAVLALAGAIVLGFVIKKALNK